MASERRISPASAPLTRRARRRAAVSLAAVLALSGGVLAGCAPAAEGSAGASSPASTAAPAVTAQPVSLPDTPLGEQAAWVLGAMNAETPGLTEEIAARVSAPLLEAVPADQLAAIFAQLRAAAPWSPTAVEDAGNQALITLTPADGAAAAAVVGGAGAIDLQLAVDAEGLVSGLLFAPAAADREPATSWHELGEAVEGFAADTSLVVTEVTDARRAVRGVEAGLDPLPGTEQLLSAGVDADAAKPSGSMFKLYVLGAVADAVEAGELAWDTPLTVTDDVKSLPSGELQDVPSGTSVTVREAAGKMIEISDNTATDLLIAAVGADAVERQFAEMGHHDPAQNTPLLTTRALFQLGWGQDAEGGALRDRWRAAGGEAERRAVVDALPAGPVAVSPSAVSTPVWQEGLDWFTTPGDLVAAHVALQEKASRATGAPVRDILSANPGLDTFGDAWSYVAFKGGSSVGVLAGSWYLERSDGRAFVVSIQGATDDPAALADTRTFFGQVQDAAALLERL